MVSVSGLQGAVDRDVFANRVSGADDELAGVFGHVDVLGISAQHGAFENVVVGAQRGAPS